jgi:DNA helicase-2/ATP-dependent DNA helicase PcrA
MVNNWLKDLNEQQLEVVTFGNGPLLVLAGAGSGKTRTLVYRVAYLISEKNIDSGSILLTTFTNKAAHEMHSRLNKLVGTSPSFSGTFHSLCAKILRKDGYQIGIPISYLIFDENDQLELVKEALNYLDYSQRDFKPRSILATISAAKNELISSIEYSQYVRGRWQESVSRVYLEYQKLLKKYQALDFDDLIMDTVHLFRTNKDILNKYRDQFRYILVDEYQDTNHAQYMLTKLISGKWRNLCCVGDASQSIYAWRGADHRNLERLKQDYPDLKILILERNYRSTQIILDAAHGVISRNKSHPILSLWTKQKGGENIQVVETNDEKEESSFITLTIRKLINGQKDYSYRDFAVLYRTNAQSRAIEEEFVKKGIPYILVGGTRFYERREIKDVLAFLRLLINKKDQISAKRIEKLGKRFSQTYQDYADKLRSKNNLPLMTTTEIIDLIFENTKYLDRFEEKDEEDMMRVENIKELRSVATEFSELSLFLENVSLVEQEHMPQQLKKTINNPNAVTLMTLHAAKGLEFSVVFLVGMEEGLFPHSRSLLEKSELEEERRLCYVGLTRAKQRVYLSYARRRLYFGSYGSSMVSRFISDIPPHLIRFIEPFNNI